MTAIQPANGKPHVLILGGGFAGLYAARALAAAPVSITVVDRNNHHLFQPMLYQVATAALSPGEIASPIRSILRNQRNAEVLLGEAASIDLAARAVHLTDGATIPYAYLIAATGARHSYFGHEDWENAAPGLKNLEDALEIRRRVFLTFEAAERERDAAARQALLTFVVVGGGPTGVELAGALAEIRAYVLRRDFRHIDPRDATVVLVEGSPRLLNSYPADLSESAKENLRRLGVVVHCDTQVTAIEPGLVRADGWSIPARTVLWAAGNAASPVLRTMGVPVDKQGRVLVGEDCAVPGHPQVFVLGDAAAFRQPDGSFVPGICPAAIQMGRHAARMIQADLRGAPRRRFNYSDKGQLAVIGRGRAVADLPRLRFTGFPAWLLWIFVHIFFLIGFRNRVIVLFEWAWSYLTYGRGARLITGTFRPAPPASAAPQPPPAGLRD